MFSLRAVDRHRTSPEFPPHAADPLDTIRVALEESPRGILACGEEGTILFANAKATVIFNAPRSALIGQPLSKLLPGTAPAAQDAAWTALWRNPRSKPAVTGWIPAGVRRDGVRVPIEVEFRAVNDGMTHHLVASLADITERIDLETRLAAANGAHLEFERLVSDLSARFGDVEPDSVDEAVADGLRQIGEALKLDCVRVWRWPSSAEPVDAASDSVAIDGIPSAVAMSKRGESFYFGAVDDLPDSDRPAFLRHGLRSAALLPLAPSADPEQTLSALALGSTTRDQEWAPPVIERVRLLASIVSQALARRASHFALQKALEEIRKLRERVVLENVELRREVKVLRTSRPVVSESAAIQQVLEQIEQVAPTNATVLLVGETGTGKEVMAQAVHDLSPRRQRQMIRVSCAAIPTSLIESELFGREKGAFTGALSRQIGRFEAAHQSTLFLDEIGELPMEVQVKLLRVIQERVIERLGSTQPVKVDVRIIAATNRNLEDAVRDKTFREDLYYRLNVFPVVVPPLRERIEDIPALVWTFIDEFSKSFGKTIESISTESMRELQRYPWPGNVRELRNVIERAVIVSTGRQLVVRAPRVGERPLPHTAMTLTELEVEHIRAVLEATNWRVRGAGGAAERLGLKPTTLESRMARLGIARKKAS